MRASDYAIVLLIFFIAIPQIVVPLVCAFGLYYWWLNKDQKVEDSDLKYYYKIKHDKKARYIPYHQYVEYLKSDKWKLLKSLRFAIDDEECQQCKQKLMYWESQCHHISYKNLTDEIVEKDLVTVCVPCHIKIHKYHGKNAQYYPLIKELK